MGKSKASAAQVPLGECIVKVGLSCALFHLLTTFLSRSIQFHNFKSQFSYISSQLQETLRARFCSQHLPDSLEWLDAQHRWVRSPRTSIFCHFCVLLGEKLKKMKMYLENKKIYEKSD